MRGRALGNECFPSCSYAVPLKLALERGDATFALSRSVGCFDKLGVFSSGSPI